MRTYIISILLLAVSCVAANAAGASDDPIERMASGALKVVVIMVIIGAVSFFRKNKDK